MLKRLSIRNLILIKRADLDFEGGFTAITGETGAGKTALIEALRLIAGERADATKVRQGASKAHITATFDTQLSSEIAPLFEESGVLFPEDEPLIISREVSKEGKSRCFILSQQVSLSFLAKLSPHLIDFVGQHAQTHFKKPKEQLLWLDQFCGIDLTTFKGCLNEEKALEKALKEDKEMQQKLDALWLRSQLEELCALKYTPGEEEALFSEFSLLCNSKEIKLHATTASELSDRAQVLCHELFTHVEKLPLAEASQLAKEVKLQLAEISSLTDSLCSKVDSDPSKLAHLEERLCMIEKAKKRFGPDLTQAQSRLKIQIEEAEGIGERIAKAERALEKARAQTDAAAKWISSERKKGATALGHLLSEKLKELNIVAAKVAIYVEPIPRCQSGDDRVSFFLRANQGEKSAAVKESSSGGELSRLLFCLKLTLSSSGSQATLVFDEIDAGVGGETATLMGEQLRELSLKGQVLCVSHFPQVARFAQHHLRVLKSTEEGRTLCQLEFLDNTQRQDEFIRMLGGAHMSVASTP